MCVPYTYVASAAGELLRTMPPEPPAYDPEELLGIIPQTNQTLFNVYEVLARLVDGSRSHAFKPRYGAHPPCCDATPCL